MIKGGREETSADCSKRKKETRGEKRGEDAADEEVQKGEAEVQGFGQAQGRLDPERAAAAPAGAPRPRHRVVVHLPPQAHRARYNTPPLLPLSLSRTSAVTVNFPP